MARLQIGAATVDAELVVFDKDGTLIDFHGVWGGRGLRAVDALGEPADQSLRDALLVTLGIDAVSGKVDGRGILAQLPHELIEARCRQTMLEAGVCHDIADSMLQRFAEVMRARPQPGELRPIGDLAALLARLSTAGVALGVVTTDDRAATQQTLAALVPAAPVGHLVCGDDPLPAKPAPDGILQITAAAGVVPQRAVMVGDTVTDMRAGRAAGCFCVAVTSGAGEAGDLSALADVMVASVHAIRVADTV